MHLADALARRRRYTSSLVASDDKQPRFFGLACGSVADPRFFARGFKTTFFFGFTRGGVLAGLFTRRLTSGLNTSLLFSLTRGGLLPCFFTRRLASGLKAPLLFGLTCGSLLACFFTRRLTSGLKTAILFSLTRGGFAARFFTRGLACSFNAALLFGRARGVLAARFFAGSLPGSLANGVEPARFFGVAGGIARYGVASRPIASAFALSRIVATPFAARAIVIPLAARKAVAVAPLSFALPRFALAQTLVGVVALTFAVRTAFIFNVVSRLVLGRTDIAPAAGWRRLRLGHRCTDGAPVIATALFDHPVEPLIDGQIDASRLVALSLALLRAEASQIPRTARFHPRAQTTSEGAVCAPLSGWRW